MNSFLYTQSQTKIDLQPKWNWHKVNLRFLFVSLLLLTGLFATSQTDFISEFDQQQAYYDSLITVQGVDSMQGTGYTQFKRRYRYWAPKLSSGYDYNDYQSDLLDYVNNYEDNSAGLNSPNWLHIGPNDIPSMGTAAKGTGQIHYIYKDPHSRDIYACSPVGGLFSSSDGEHWKNAGTDKGLPRPGVSSVVIEQKPYDRSIFITTGNGEGFDNEKAWQTSIGVWRSQNNGNIWQNIGLTSDSQGDIIFHMRKIIKITNLTDSTHVIVTTTEGLYESRNANKENPTWNELIEGEFYDVVQDLDNSNIIYASGSNNTGIYKYNLITNVGTRIFDIDTITLPHDTMVIKKPKLRRISVKISPANSNYLFALVSMRDYNYTAIYRYNISTQTWHRFYTSSAFNGYARKLGWDIRPKINSNEQIQIIGRDVNPLYVINNGLSNDTSANERIVDYQDYVNPHDDFHYILIGSSDSIVWAGTDGGVYRGEFINDTLIKWESRNYGLGVSTIEHIDASESGKLIVSGQYDCGSNTYVTEDETEWYIVERTHGDGYKNTVVSDQEYIVSSQNGSIRKYILNSFTSMNVGNYNAVDTACNPTYESLPYANFSTYYVKLSDVFYAAGAKEVMKYYNNTWHEWSDLTQQIGCAISGTWRVAAKNNGGIHQIYASARYEDANYHYLYKSINGGGPSVNNWTKVYNTPTEGFISAIEITNNSDSVLVAIKDSIYYVNTTTPASPIWGNITFNLDVGNINSIDRDNSKTWIATERGVYYLDNGSNTWINYTTNLPNCEVKDIKVVNNRVYAGTYGRGLWFTSAPSCNNTISDYTITESNDVVHNGITKEFHRNVIVPTGITYTIYGTVEMAANCKIVVQRGAKLIIDGGTITKACPDFWQGVELWGNSNAVQDDTTSQGWVILKNGATIEYAVHGIATVKNDSVSSDLNYAGGVIQADSAFFINNTNAITLFPYPKAYGDFLLKDNLSYFKNCRFTYDSSYYYLDDSPAEHVSLSDVIGVLFESNVFENTTSRIFTIGFVRGIGILGWNSGYYLLKDEEAEKGNVFDNLNYGVKSYAFTGNNRLIEIDQNEFNHNRTGCLLSAEYYAVVTRNIFNITTKTGEAAHGFSGLYLDACNGYAVEENEFYSNCNTVFSSSISRTYGLVVNYSGTEENMIYNNSFHNLGNGGATHVQEINRSRNGLTGLVIKCNDYDRNSGDIVVSYLEYDEDDGIKASQGTNSVDPESPAGNTFSHFYQEDNIYSDYTNTCSNITYWHHYPNFGAPYVVPTFSSPIPKINTRMNEDAPGYSKATACPSNRSKDPVSEIKSEIVINKATEEAYSDSLSLLVDDGNTTALNLNVATSVPPETMQLRDELLQASPYLSDTVMIAAAEKEDVLPNSIITEVLSANPQSAKSDNVLLKLDERTQPLNNNQLAQIHSNDTIIGNKELLETNKAYYSNQKAMSVYELARLYMSGTNKQGIHDSIEYALTNINSTVASYQQAFCRYFSSDSTGVLNKLNNISSEFDFDDNQTAYHGNYNNYFNVLLNLQSNNNTAMQLDSSQKNQVYGIMNNTDGLLHAYARNMLMFNDNLEYNEPYNNVPGTSSEKSLQANEYNTNINYFSKTYFQLYPNPASEYLSIEYSLNYGTTDAAIEIMSISGINITTVKLVVSSGSTIIDLRNWETGTYIVKLVAKGNILQSEKVIKH
jgi:type IX secretion system substrate protein